MKREASRSSRSSSSTGILSRVISAVSGRSEEEGDEKATDLLKSEHDEVRALFKQFEKASDGATAAKKRTIDTISRMLEVHAEMEEKVFYPACQNLDDEDAQRIVAESKEEHQIVKRLIKELEPLSGSDERFTAKATVLKESVDHHAGEEESDLFPVAESELGDDRLRELGRKMASMKSRLSSGRKARSASKRVRRTASRKRR